MTKNVILSIKTFPDGLPRFFVLGLRLMIDVPAVRDSVLPIKVRAIP